MEREQVAEVIAARIRVCRTGEAVTEGPGREYWREREAELRKVASMLGLDQDVEDELYLMEGGP